MATSEVSICNIAISWLGGTKIVSFKDDTAEAKLCSAIYEDDRDAVLEERNWTFAMKRVQLNKLVDSPAYGYTSMFQLPVDHIRTVAVSSHFDFDYTLNNWSQEEDRILIDTDVAYLLYVKKCVDPTRFSPGFIQTLAARIAADIAVPLTSNIDLATHYRQLYGILLETGGNMNGLQGRNQSLNAVRLIGVR